VLSSGSMGTLTYRRAGVDQEAQNAFTALVGRMVMGSQPEEVLAGVGGFAAVYAPRLDRLARPLLVSAADGVGTKLRLALLTGIHDTVGIDLVAMCVNDILTTGATPLFFLDYFATARLDTTIGLKVISGIVEGCRQARCALVGGETAEMPGFYPTGLYELAGFAVGLVDEPNLVTGAACEAGDILIGLPSTGAHANGFSLIRRIITRRKLDLDHVYEGFDRPLGEVLLTPTAIYVRPVLELLGQAKVKAMAHITGGAIPGNLPRVLPKSVHPVISKASIPSGPLFAFLKGRDVAEEEMWRVFNMGVGFVLVVAPDMVDGALSSLARSGMSPFVAGHLEAGPGEVQFS